MRDGDGTQIWVVTGRNGTGTEIQYWPRNGDLVFRPVPSLAHPWLYTYHILNMNEYSRTFGLEMFFRKEPEVKTSSHNSEKYQPSRIMNDLKYFISYFHQPNKFKPLKKIRNYWDFLLADYESPTSCESPIIYNNKQ